MHLIYIYFLINTAPSFHTFPPRQLCIHCTWTSSERWTGREAPPTGPTPAEAAWRIPEFPSDLKRGTNGAQLKHRHGNEFWQKWPLRSPLPVKFPSVGETGPSYRDHMCEHASNQMVCIACRYLNCVGIVHPPSPPNSLNVLAYSVVFLAWRDKTSKQVVPHSLSPTSVRISCPNPSLSVLTVCVIRPVGVFVCPCLISHARECVY